MNLEVRTVRLLWLMGGRIITLATLLAIALVFQATSAVAPLLEPVYAIVGTAFVLSLLYSLIFRYFSRSDVFIHVQLIIDILMVTTLVYFTGGPDSRFLFLYPIVMIAAAILLGRTAAYLYAVLVVAVYGAMIVSAIQGWIPGPRFGLFHSYQDLAYHLALNAFFLTLLALLIGYLADRLWHETITLEQLLNSMPGGLIVFDEKFNILKINAAARRILELPVAHSGQFFKVLNLPTSLVEKMMNRLKDLNSIRLERPIETIKSTRKDLGFTLSRIKKRQKGMHYMCIFQDLTEKKLLQRQLKQRDRLATMGQLAGVLAHEIRNPLGSMQGSAQLLARDLQLEAEQKTLFDIILREINRLSRFVWSFLNFAKPTRCQPQLVSLEPLLNDCMILLRKHELRKDSHQMTWSVEPDLHGYIDPDQFKQIIWNLALNALRAMPQGGSLEISLKEAEENSHFLVEVVDSGKGIEAQKLAKIVHAFEHDHWELTEMGMGMALIQRIVSEHSGRFHIESIVDGGTRIHIVLPRSPRSWTESQELQLSSELSIEDVEESQESVVNL